MGPSQEISRSAFNHRCRLQLLGVFPATGRGTQAGSAGGRVKNSKVVFLSRSGEKPAPDEMNDRELRKHSCEEKWTDAGVCFRQSKQQLRRVPEILMGGKPRPRKPKVS